MPTFGVVHALDAASLAKLATPGQLAFVKFDPPTCKQCAAMDPFWQLVATHFDGGRFPAAEVWQSAKFADFIAVPKEKKIASNR